MTVSVIGVSSTMMKGSYTILLVMFGFLDVKAQCTVDLGNDIHVCTQLQTGFQTSPIGGQLVVTNATPPLAYEWSIEPIETFFGDVLFASDFLDDTTVANPNIHSIWEDSLTFFLEVIDAYQQICHDTITVSASLFTSHLGTVSYTITAGDSVELFFGPNISSNYPTDSLVWRPHIGITVDSTSLTPWVSPPHSVDYYCVVWDSQGCMQEGSPFQYVQVDPVGIDPELLKTPLIYSTHSSILIEIQELLDFQLLDIKGKQILHQVLPTGRTRIPTENFKPGVYLYSLTSKNGATVSGKVLLNRP